MKKVYLAGGISDTDRKKGQKRTAKKIRELGFEVYAAAENNSINDKTNDPTPLDIYNGDIERVKECDIFVVRISGGNEDGTISEIGMVAGWNEMLTHHSKTLNVINKHSKRKYGVSWEATHSKPIEIVAYTTNERLMHPQFWHGIASGGFNHLVAGMIDKWGTFVGGEKEMLDYLEGMISND